jgi:hypothetical protein
MSKRARRIWLLVSFLIAGGLAHLLVRASATERTRLQNNYNAIAAMTRIDRLRLERNFEEFNAMSPQEQAAYRDLHDRLEADEQTGGEHVEVMDSYYAWLATVGATQRERLRKETDPQARRDLAETIVDEQQALPPEFDQGWGWWFPKLSSQQLDDVFSVVEAQVPLNMEQQLQLDALRSDQADSENPSLSQEDKVRQLQRHMLMLQILVERFRSPDGQAHSLLPHAFHRLNEFGVLELLLDAMGDEGLKQTILQDQHGPAVGFGGLIYISVRAELEDFWNDNAPDDKRLEELLHSLPVAEQDELLSLSAQDFRDELTVIHQQELVKLLSQSDDVIQLYPPWPRRHRWGFGGGGRGDRGQFRGNRDNNDNDRNDGDGDREGRDDNERGDDS